MFRKRHPELRIRCPERVSKARAAVTEVSIREWFNVLQANLEYLGIKDILDDPKRVFNTDETNIQLSTKTGNVISIKGWKNVYEIAPAPEKSTLTFLGTFSASGEIVAPTLVFPYVRVPADITRLMPKDFSVATSESGWMTAPIFYEFVCNDFNNWLMKNEIQKPVILFVDGHSTHLTMQLSVKSEELGIFMYLLPPHTMHMLQPADVGIFKPIKTKFKQLVHSYQRDHLGEVIRRKDVGPFLEKCLSLIKRENIIKAFKATGLCPLDPNKVDFSKCLEIAEISDDESSNTSTNDDPLTEIDADAENKYKIALNVIKTEIGEDDFNGFISNNEEGNPLCKLIRNIYTKSRENTQNNQQQAVEMNLVENETNNLRSEENLPEEFIVNIPPGEMIIEDIVDVLPRNHVFESPSTPSAISEIVTGSNSSQTIEVPFLENSNTMYSVIQSAISTMPHLSKPELAPMNEFEVHQTNSDSVEVTMHILNDFGNDQTPPYVPSSAENDKTPPYINSPNERTSLFKPIEVMNLKTTPSQDEETNLTMPNTQVPNKETNQILDKEMNQLPNEEMNRKHNEEMNQILNEEMNQILNEDMNQIPNEVMSQLINEDINQIPNEEINQILNEEMNQIPNEEMNQIPNKEMNQILNEEMNQIPNEEMNQIPNEELNQTPNEEMNQLPNISPVASTSRQETNSAQAEGKGKSVLVDHIFWEVKMTYKKWKHPKKQAPSCISTPNYRRFRIEEDKTKKKSKKKSQKWNCVYCQISYSEDMSNNRDKTWIECDLCPNTMHISCIPVNHANKYSIGLLDDIDEIEETIEFLCEVCEY